MWLFMTSKIYPKLFWPVYYKGILNISGLGHLLPKRPRLSGRPCTAILMGF